MALTSGTKLGPYEIRSALGAGGMGEVYRARDMRLDRFVAIKILQSHLSCSPELKARFEREARTLSSLSHPHICSLYDVGKDGDVEFLVMELLEGETLSARLQRGQLPVNAVVKLGIEIADALAKAHRLGVIHRDLKPSNIMLTANGAKLMDFGLAKPNVAGAGAGPSLAELATATLQSPSSPLSSAGTLIGTIQYMAPEQIEGKDADSRSDIFALGSVLYEAATGRRAFEGKTHLHIASAILQKDPAPITAENPDVSLPVLDSTIRTCMAKEPEERFQSAHDVKLQLISLAQVVSAQTARGKKSSSVPWIATAAVVLVLLATILAIATIYEAVLGYARRLIVMVVGARLDAKLNLHVFNRLLRLPLDHNIPSIVVVFHGRVSGNADLINSRQHVKSLFDDPVQISNLPLRVTCDLGVDVHNVAILRFQPQVRAFELAQALRKEPGAHQQHK